MKRKIRKYPRIERTYRISEPLTKALAHAAICLNKTQSEVVMLALHSFLSTVPEPIVKSTVDNFDVDAA